MRLFLERVSILGICIFLSGCTDSSNYDPELGVDSIIKEEEIMVTPSNYYASVENQCTSEVEIVPFQSDSEIRVHDCLLQRSEQGDLITIEIHYPQIRIVAEDNKLELENKINEQIFDYVMMDEYLEWTDSRYNSALYYDICYVGDDYLSIVFEGYLYEHNHPKAPSALNFDLHTGELVDLEDIVSPVELEEMFSANTERIVESKESAIVGGKAGVIEYLHNYLQEENHRYDFFITERGIKIIIFSEMDERNYFFQEIELQNG